MNATQERLVYADKESITNRVALLDQASLNLESIAPKPEPMLAKDPSYRGSMSPRVSSGMADLAIQPPVSPEAVDQASRIILIRQQLEDIHADMALEVKAA